MAAAAAAIYHLNQADTFAKAAVVGIAGNTSSQSINASSGSTYQQHHSHHGMFSAPPPIPQTQLQQQQQQSQPSSHIFSSAYSNGVVHSSTQLAAGPLATSASGSASVSNSIGSSLNPSDYAQIGGYKEAKFYHHHHHSTNEFLSDYEKRLINAFRKAFLFSFHILRVFIKVMA